MLRTFTAVLVGAAALAVAAVAGVGRSDSFPAPVAAAPSAPPTSPPLAILGEHLVRVDAETLAPLPGTPIDAGSGGCASRGGGEACWNVPPWSFSAGSSRLALARNGRFAVRSVRLVDVARFRVDADLRLGGGPIGALAWLGPGPLLAVQEVCCSNAQRLLAVDVARRRVTARRALPGSVLRLEQARRELVLLLGRRGRVGEARLGVADAHGRLRVVRLGRIAAGVSLEVTGMIRSRSSIPGLAVDPAGRRAFVVAPGLVAVIDLRSLAVSYHRPARSASLLARIHAWLEPNAEAKSAYGPSRVAHWLGGGLLAVTGSDAHGRTSKPAGLVLVDTRSWSVRTIDEKAVDVVAAGDLLLVTGNGLGLTAYGLDGKRRFRLFDGETTWIDRVFAGKAYVGISGAAGPKGGLRVVDLARRRTIGERPMPIPWLLLEASSGWWGP
jgi:hypothetical protein